MHKQSFAEWGTESENQLANAVEREFQGGWKRTGSRYIRSSQKHIANASRTTHHIQNR